MGVRGTPPFAFFCLNACIGWPIGVVGLALSNALVRSGLTMGQTASIVAAAGLPYTLQFLLGPIVDSSGTRRRWFAGGAVLMCLCLAALVAAPWRTSTAPLLALLAFLSNLGANFGAAANKGLIAYHARPDRMATASGWYIAGGGFSHAVAGAATLFLLAHVASRQWVALISIGAPALAATAIFLFPPEQPAQMRDLPANLGVAFKQTWNLIRSRTGLVVALACLVPFGTGGAGGLTAAIAPHWSVDPGLLAAVGALGAIGGVGAPLAAGWLSVWLGAWRTFIALGWMLIVATIALAVLPHGRLEFAVIWLLFAAAGRAATAALLAIVMSAVGRGAASTKATALWSLAALPGVYLSLVMGAVYERTHSADAMLFVDATLSSAGFILLVVTAFALGTRLRESAPKTVRVS